MKFDFLQAKRTKKHGFNFLQAHLRALDHSFETFPQLDRFNRPSALGHLRNRTRQCALITPLPLGARAEILREQDPLSPHRDLRARLTLLHEFLILIAHTIPTTRLRELLPLEEAFRNQNPRGEGVSPLLHQV